MKKDEKLTGSEISGILRNEIKAMAPGDRILPEIELAKKFKISRATMNKIIVKLVDEKILTRKKFDGTFVAEPTVEKPVLTFLVPCPDFFSSCSESRSIGYNHLCGATRCAYEAGVKVEHVIVSPNNNRENINWQNIEHIDQNSLVFVDGFWYEPLFPYLQKSGAKIGIINSQIKQYEEYQGFLDGCYQVKMHRREAVEALYGAMARRNCKRIGIFARNVDEELHPLRSGFIAGAIAHGGNPEALYSLPMMPDPSVSIETRIRLLHAFQKKFQLDGIILFNHLFLTPYLTNLHRILDLPEDIQIGVFDGCVNDLRPGADCIVSAFDQQAVGYNTVKALLNPDFTPGVEDLYAEIY